VKNQENNSSGLNAGVFLQSSFCAFEVCFFNRRDAKKNQENKFFGSSADAFLRSSLCAFAVKQKTAETQRKIKRIITVVPVQMQFSEVPFAPLRLNKKPQRRGEIARE
jgi:hypothetical protein